MREEEEDTAVETSFEEFAKRAEESNDADEDDTIITLDRDDTAAETLSVKVLPQQGNEFTCRKCFLVKHRSQIADKKKLYCTDCA